MTEPLARQSTMTRREIRADEVEVGDMREVGRDSISRVVSIGPYYELDEVGRWNGSYFEGQTWKKIPSERYITINDLDPPKRKDEVVVVWR
jgi:hypothetical protein